MIAAEEPPEIPDDPSQEPPPTLTVVTTGRVSSERRPAEPKTNPSPKS